MRGKNETSDINAAKAETRAGPRPLDWHLLNTANLLSLAAWPLMADPQQRDRVLAAVRDLAHGMMSGLRAYRTAGQPMRKRQYETVWSDGSTRLQRVPAQAGGTPVLLVPSLVNRADILDLDGDDSFARYLCTRGLAPYILDWGAPQEIERAFTINDYITRRLYPALAALEKKAGRPHVLGYCMGGTMAVGALAAWPDLAAHARSLTALAAPWDFHADGQGPKMQNFLAAAQPVMQATGVLPVDWIQAMFAAIDPLFLFNKFRTFAGLEPDSDAARRFVLVEDWLNDGVDLAAPAAQQALAEWYLQNQPYNGVWTIGAGLVTPSALASLPVCVVAATGDRLVPHASAMGLVRQLDSPTVLEPSIGHIGMMASPRARTLLWEPLADWLLAQS